jgi:CxxC motif-containing protein (DUF1111 family)
MAKLPKVYHRAFMMSMACSGLMVSCATEEPGEEDDLSFEDTEQAVIPIGEALPGITEEDFTEAKDAFATAEELDEGLGPIFNERGCGNCHTQGAIGGAGIQIERRFGRFNNGRFDDLANRGGSLRQLFTVDSFTGADGQSCTVPLEVEPREATVRNVGRLTTPLFGLGLVDSLPDSTFDDLARSQQASIRGTANRVTILLPNAEDRSQRTGGTRVGRFGWKAGIATLVQFAADAYVNEMGITTQHCVAGRSILDFALESRPNGIAQPAGCDDLAPPHGVAGIPTETDDVVGSCADGLTEIQDDVVLFTNFMTMLAPPPTLRISDSVRRRALRSFDRAGCAGCHVTQAFRTPSRPANGVPGNFAFRPFSDFLVHDMGSLGDNIGNDGDSTARTRQMRTAPLWGLRFRTLFLHDGRATTVNQAIHFHSGQAAASVREFDALSRSDRDAIFAFLKTI